MSTSHDALFGQVFAHPHHAVGELRALLPEPIERLVAWDTLRRLPTADKDVALGDRHADLLFGVQIGQRDALIYLLLEHKSQPDRFAVLQLLGYVVRILDRHRREAPRDAPLPPILALVVHHGPAGWNRATTLHELFDLEPELDAALAPYLPQLRILLDDLAIVAPADLARRTLTALAHLTLAVMRRVAQGADIPVLLRELRSVFHAAERAADSSGLLTAVLTYLGKVRDLSRRELQQHVHIELGPALEELMKSTHDQVLDEGRRIGFAQGRAEGEAQGKTQGKAEFLLGLLAQRFGKLPAPVVQRIRLASESQLDRFGLRVLDAARLDDVFADA